jgi:hypothetical protein
MSDPSSSANLKVARVEEGDFEVVLNAGRDKKVALGQRYILYRTGVEIRDPDTGEPLGILERVLGTGVISHVQDRLSVLKSTEQVTLPPRILKRPYLGIVSLLETEEVKSTVEDLPFRDPKVGDLAKRV